MGFASLAFAAFSIVAVAVFHLVRSPRWRVAATIALNFLFLSSFIDSPFQAIPLAGFVVLGYAAVVTARRMGRAVYFFLLAAIILLFVWLKQYAIVAFLPELPFAYSVIGLSYMLFRVIHLVVDVRQGFLAAPSFGRYLAYVFFFLGLVSGPIQRYEDFDRQLTAPALPRDSDRIYRAFQRLLWGLFLVAVLSHLTEYLFRHTESRVAPGLSSLYGGLEVIFAMTCLTFLIHLYVNFCGYMEMVIGIGMLCGFDLPENFNRPYLASDFLDLWARWHMTLSNWFKTYLFNPSLKFLAGRGGAPAMLPYWSVLAFFLTFSVMGIWHGSTIAFLCYGLALGLGASVNKLYHVEMVRRLGKARYRALAARWWYVCASRSMAISYFAVVLAAFWLPQGGVFSLLSYRGAGILAFAFAGIAGVIFIVNLLLLPVPAMLRRFRFPTFSATRRAAPFVTGLQFAIVVMMIAAVDAGSVPEFVYRVF